MAIQHADYDGEPGVSKRLWRSKWNKHHVQVDFEDNTDYNDNGENHSGFQEENGGIL